MKKLLLGIILVLCTAGCDAAYLSSRKMLSQNAAQSRLVEQIRETATAKRGTWQTAAELFPLEWERLCIFNWYAQLSSVNPALGVDWVTPSEELIATGYEGYTMADFQVVVFVHSGEVVQHLVFSGYPFQTDSMREGVACFQNQPDLVVRLGTGSFYFPKQQ